MVDKVFQDVEPPSAGPETPGAKVERCSPPGGALRFSLCRSNDSSLHVKGAAVNSSVTHKLQARHAREWGSSEAPMMVSSSAANGDDAFRTAERIVEALRYLEKEAADIGSERVAGLINWAAVQAEEVCTE